MFSVFRLTEILTELKRRNKFTVVGGAWVTVKEEYFGHLADVIFIGEAEQTWPAFLEQWSKGTFSPRYEQAEKSDMTLLPTPRYDLLKMGHYINASIQISRGCPFACEFCDIIVTFGQRPRIKNSTQVLSELEALRVLKVNSIFIVDDNFIGNKQVVKLILKDIINYQKENGFPFRFFTEASVNLAEDEELMQLMVEANINAVFIGIESPNEQALKEAGKTQNLERKAGNPDRKGGTLLARVQRIHSAGMEVWCGMIVGFDSDDETIFPRQIEFLKQAKIPHAMIGMLYAIPKTPLHARLLKEGRLDQSDQPEFGTNVIPIHMSRSALLEGYISVTRNLYQVDNYFERLDSLYLRGELGRKNLGRVKFWKDHFFIKLRFQFLNCIGASILLMRLMKHVKSKELRQEYFRRIKRVAIVTKDPSIIFTYIGKCAMHFHYVRLLEELNTKGGINSI